MKITSVALLASLPWLAACGGTKMLRPDTVTAPKAPLKLIATVSGSDEFTAKLTEELANRGYGILDQVRTASLLQRLDFDASTVTEPGALAELKTRRVDAVLKLVVSTTGSDRFNLLDKVRATVLSTDEGLMLASIDWTNSWGGEPGSPADKASRQKPAAAARLIADELARQLGAPGAKATVYMDDLIAARKARLTAPAAATTPAPAPVAAPKELSSDVDSPRAGGAERPDDFALVIGIEEYQSLPKADYGARDAQTVRKHLAALGVPERNIITLAGSQATGSKLKSYLQQWLPRNVKPTSTLFVYYSGHGAPDPENGTAYLVPWDTDAMFLATTAYPLKQFYADLAAIKSKRTIVALDACFSGSGGRSVLAKGARPLVAKVDDAVPAGANLTVLAAASGTEITGSLEDQGHGIFTYWFLKGLSSGAKSPRALYDYLKPKVQDDARRQNREQSPTLAGPADAAF